MCIFKVETTFVNKHLLIGHSAIGWREAFVNVITLREEGKLMGRSERIKVKSNTFEITTLLVSIILMVTFLFLQLQKGEKLNDFIKDFVQVNISSTLSISALVASMGAFRWEHYRKALLKRTDIDKYERRKIIFNNAKLPLYRIIKLNGVFIVINILTLQAATIKLDRIKIFHLIVNWEWIIIILVCISLIVEATLIYISTKYMKELIFK